MDNNINHNSNFIGQSKQFNEKINTIKMQFFAALDDFKKYYVYYKKNPELNEYENYYANSKGQLQTMSSNLFSTTNSIYKTIEELNSEMTDILEKIKKEEELNDKLLKKLKTLENTQNGSEILVSDSKISYNRQYYKNWEMFIGIIGVTILTIKIYKTPVIK